MSARSSARHLARFVIHNWPLKLAAIALATLLYAGLIASQDSSTYSGVIQVTAVNQPTGTVVTNQLGSVEQIRYLAPIEVGRPSAQDFEATVDLTGVDPTGHPVNVRVDVVPNDPRITILEVEPRTIQVVLDETISLAVPVRVARGTVPVGIELGDTVFSPKTVTVTGPSTAASQVVAARVNVALDPSGLDFDRDVEVEPIDAAGEVVRGVDVEPRTVHVTVPLFTNRSSRTLPVNPIVTGVPAPGFRITSVEVTPLVVAVEGDAEELAQLTQVDTAPVAVFGATRDVTGTVALALPAGVVPLGVETVNVVVHLEPMTGTRTFTAGLRLDGRDPGLLYDLTARSVLLTLFGSTADLDRLAAAPLVVGLNVAGLGPGDHPVPVVPSLPTGVTVAAIDPAIVTVTIGEPQMPAPSAASRPGPPSPSAAP